MNQIHVIKPYRDKGQWMFDDESVGLHREPFVSGADDILELMTADMPNAHNGVVVLFSNRPFPNYQASLNRKHPEYGGTWYDWNTPNFVMQGWLCPALLKYFNKAPKKIYLQLKPVEGTSDQA